eukprot:1466665-Rhodomonas_salina.1
MCSTDVCHAAARARMEEAGREFQLVRVPHIREDDGAVAAFGQRAHGSREEEGKALRTRCAAGGTDGVFSYRTGISTDRVYGDRTGISTASTCTRSLRLMRLR